MKQLLKGQWVLLTGASSGIGRQLCKLLIEKQGAKVFGVGRDETKMQTLQAELGENAVNFRYALFDVSEKTAWEDLKEQLSKEGISPILLINNAGAFPVFAKTLEIGSETVERLLRINFLSSVYSAELLLPSMMEAHGKNAGFVNICSSSALGSVVGTAAYCASKAAMRAYTESLSLELSGKAYVGIFYPGTTGTELFRNDEQTKESALDKIAMPPEKMAKKLLKKIVARKRRAVVGWDAKAMNLMAKLFPVKGPQLICWVMKKSGSKVFKNVF